MMVSFTFDPGAPRSSRAPVHADISRVGWSSIARMKSPVLRPAFAAGEPSRAAITRSQYCRVSSTPIPPFGSAVFRSTDVASSGVSQAESASRPSARPRIAPCMMRSGSTDST